MATITNKVITSPKMAMFINCMYIPSSDTFGNGTESARAAKYKGNDNTLAMTASRLIRNDKIIAAKEVIQAELRLNHIADRNERQNFWTDTMLTAPNIADRLRASELLGRSEADFTDNVNKTGEGLSISVTAPDPVVVPASKPQLSREGA